jgi:hypothetical protein
MTTATWLERYRTRYLSDDGISFSLGTINLNILALTEVQEWPHRRGMISHHGVSIKSTVAFDRTNTSELLTIPIGSSINPAVSCTERY